MPQARRSAARTRKRSDPRSAPSLDVVGRARAAYDLYCALSVLVGMIAYDQLIPETVSYMKGARAALAKWRAVSPAPAPACVGKSHVWGENKPGTICQCGAARL